MHEASLAQAICEQIEQEGRSSAFTRVRCVELEIGELAPVDAQALAQALDIALRQTVAKGARLHITHPPGQAWCTRCGRTIALAHRTEGCPTCGSHQLLVTGGEQMRLRALVVD